jgi:hypothetical protein
MYRPDHVIHRSNNVIASQRVGARRRPMTGSAKQSILSFGRSMDCFVAPAFALRAAAGAPRNDDL